MQACREIPTRFVCAFAWFFFLFRFFACLVIFLCLLFAHFCFDRAPSLTACLFIGAKELATKPSQYGDTVFGHNTLHYFLQAASQLLYKLNMRVLLDMRMDMPCIIPVTCSCNYHALCRSESHYPKNMQFSVSCFLIFRPWALSTFCWSTHPFQTIPCPIVSVPGDSRLFILRCRLFVKYLQPSQFEAFFVHKNEQFAMRREKAMKQLCHNHESAAGLLDRIYRSDDHLSCHRWCDTACIQ